MKKICFLFTALLLSACLLLPSCKKGGEETPPQETTTNNKEPSTNEEPSTEATPTDGTAAEETTEEETGKGDDKRVWLPDELLDIDYLNTALGDARIADLSDGDLETQSEILLTAKEKLSDVHFVKLGLEGVNDDGRPLYSADEKIYFESIAKDEEVIMLVTFFGDMPEYGLTFTDPDGEEHAFAIWVSGMDGSLSFEEIALPKG